MHYGLRELAIPDAEEGYGIKTVKGEGAGENFAAYRLDGVARYAAEKRELVYESSRREPLGRSYVRGFDLPPDAGFAGFGVATTSANMSAKETVFRWAATDVEESAADRGYAWPEATKSRSFRFGKKGEEDELPIAEMPRTEIGSLLLARKRLACNEPLGSARHTAALPVAAGHAFGKAGEKPDGGGPLHHYVPEAKETPRALPWRQGKEAFGVPTVRADLRHKVPPLDRRSVSSSTNYGDDVGAVDLVFPFKFRWKGLEEEEFCRKRGEEELRDILKVEEFEEAFREAGEGGKEASLEEMMQAVLSVRGRQKHGLCATALPCGAVRAA